MVTAAILTKDSQDTIHKTLNSLKGFSEVVVLDTGSSDSTIDIASSYTNVKVYHSIFTSLGKLHNIAANHATNDWILSIDSDEVLTKPLPKNLNPDTVYSFPFHNYFNGKWIKWCGWYPDRHVRLYNKQTTKFSEAFIHEGVITTDCNIKALNIPIDHYSYRSIEDFSKKLDLYSTLFAKQYQGKKKSSFTKALVHGGYAFFKSYILQRGFLGGKEGYIISSYNGQTAYYKYLKLAFLNASNTRLP